MTTISWNLPPFLYDQRGNKLNRYKVADGKREPEKVVLLCGPEDVASQFAALAGTACTPAVLSETGKKKYTHGFRFPEGLPDWAGPFLDVMTQVVTLPPRPLINLGISLDWYKAPDDDGELQNTAMGTCINRTKYAPYPNGSGSRAAWREMRDAVATFVPQHPAFQNAGVITAPPGHLADGNSWGERLAKETAAKLGKPYVATTAAGVRPEQKELASSNLAEAFTMAQTVSGRVLIIDDVFHSGSTMDGAAAAARRAGATEVITLTVARTLRK